MAAPVRSTGHRHLLASPFVVSALAGGHTGGRSLGRDTVRHRRGSSPAGMPQRGENREGPTTGMVGSRRATGLHPNKMPSGGDHPRGPGTPPPQDAVSFPSEAVVWAATSQSPLSCRGASVPSW